MNKVLALKGEREKERGCYSHSTSGRAVGHPARGKKKDPLRLP